MGRAVSGLNAYLDWQQRLRDYETSGLSVEAFCQQEDVSRSKFVDWLLILKQKRSKPVGAESEAGDDTAEGAAFVPVSVKASSSSYEIGLPNGSLVRLPADIDHTVLMDIIHAVGALPQESPA